VLGQRCVMKTPDKNIKLIEPIEDTSGIFIKRANAAKDPVVRGMNVYLDEIHAQGKTLMDISREAGEPQPDKDPS